MAERMLVAVDEELLERLVAALERATAAIDSLDVRRENEQQPLLLGIADAAQLLGISRRSLERILADGRITPVHLGSRRLVPRHELEYLAGSVTTMRSVS